MANVNTLSTTTTTTTTTTTEAYTLGYQWEAGVYSDVEVGAICTYGEEAFLRDPLFYTSRFMQEVVDDYGFRSEVRRHRTAADIHFLLLLGLDPREHGYPYYEEGYELKL